MKPLLLIAALCLVVCGCDGGFRVRGRIVASDRTELRDCSLQLKGPPEALECCDGPVAPDGFETSFTVPPVSTRYTLVLTCRGFLPDERRITYGETVSPTKPLDLGAVTLIPETPVHLKVLADGQHCVVNDKEMTCETVGAYLRDSLHVVPKQTIGILLDGTPPPQDEQSQKRVTQSLRSAGYARTIVVGFLSEPDNTVK